MREYTASEFMTVNISSCSKETLMSDVVQTLHSNRFSCLVIVENGQPVGIITERDMVAILADMLEEVKWIDLAVKNFMTAPVITVSGELSLYEVLMITGEKGIRHIPVVDEENMLIGLLTQTDFVRAYYQSLKEETL